MVPDRCHAGSSRSPAASGCWRNRAARLLIVVLASCKNAPARPYPGSAISIAARASAGSGASRIDAAADSGPTVRLRSGASGIDFFGALPLRPGAHTVVLRALDAKGDPLGSASVEALSARGCPSLLDATIPSGGGAATPVLGAVTAARNSLVVGETVVLHADAPADAKLTWAAEPRACARFADAAAATTECTATASGACAISVVAAAGERIERRTLSLAVRSTGRSYEYPLRAAPGGRYLIDQRGTPFLIKGESAWLALVNLTAAEQDRYLADRGSKGFNLVEVMLMNHGYTMAPNPAPPADRSGEQPFLRPGDFATPNDAYFDRAVAFVDRAAAHGIVVLIAPSYLGFDGGREGWWQEITSSVNTREVCAAFGRYLGARFKGKKNLLWLAGGDYAPAPGSEGEARHLEILRGIRAAGAPQPWTGHWNLDHLGGISTDAAAFQEAMALNGVYQYAMPYRDAARAYDVVPPRPVFLLESTYEHEHPADNTQPFRKAWWWTMLSGGTGTLWGDTFLWMAESARATYPAEYGETDHAVSSWGAELDSPGTMEMVHLHALFETLPWQRLVPSGPASGWPRPLVTSGQGWGGLKHIAAAATPEGDLLVAYIPPTGDGSRKFELDLSRMRGGARARWYDPGSGAWLPLDTRLAAATGAAFETPGGNAAGANDWVLILESPRP